MHDFIHDKGSPGHISRVFHKRDEGIEDQDIGQEDDDTAHTADDSVDQQVFQRTFRHIGTHQVADLLYDPLDALHRIVAQAEGGFKHDPHEKQENGEAQYFVCDDQIDDLGACRFLDLVLFERLAQGSGDETIAGVGKGCFAIFL